MTEIRGSEPWSRRSSSLKVRRGRYSGPLSRRFMYQACSPSARRSGSSSGEDLVHPGLGIVGAQLLLDEGTFPAAGQQGDHGGVTGDFQGEGFGDGDGAQQVLHSQQRALPGALRGDGHQPVFGLGLAAE